MLQILENLGKSGSGKWLDTCQEIYKSRTEIWNCHGTVFFGGGDHYNLNFCSETTVKKNHVVTVMPGFYHSVVVLPLLFRHSTVVKFRCSVKIT